METTKEAQELKYKAGLADCSKDVLNFWLTFENSYPTYNEYLIKVLEELVLNNLSVSDLYLSCRHTQSTEILYNLKALKYLKENKTSKKLSDLNAKEWSVLSQNIIYLDPNGTRATYPVANYNDIPNRKFLKANEITTFFENDLQVIGEVSYLSQVLSALNLLKAKAPNALKIILENIGLIRQWPESGMVHYSFPPTFLMSTKVSNVSITWCASCIAHEAHHSKLYREYAAANPGKGVPAEVHSGQTIEVECNKFQLSVMSLIDAPKSEIDWLKSQDGSHWNLPWSDPPRGY